MSEGFYVSKHTFSSNDETWKTPTKLFRDLNKEFSFALDACALQSSALVDKWYGPDHPLEEMRDCLTGDWFAETNGRPAFMNPPYGREIGQFMHKAMQESKKGMTVVCLVPVRTDTSWFHETVFASNAQIRFIRGRLRFSDGPNDAPFPSCVVVFGARYKMNR